MKCVVVPHSLATAIKGGTVGLTEHDIPINGHTEKVFYDVSGPLSEEQAYVFIQNTEAIQKEDEDCRIVPFTVTS
jgi:hypothetical protein|tara:strand:+ start:41 stop:265 length:225 start_codon:yes stop_codon:yes gene_type:complete